jgi:3-oxoacyl-[acyl-carrier-protein] synthase II
VDDRSIAVTGIGVASALGTGCAALWEGVEQGRDGLRPITRFATEGFSSTMAGLWPAWEGKPCPAPGVATPPVRTLRTEEIAIVAAREARLNARLTESGVAPTRIAVVLGTCFGEAFEGFHTLTEGVADAVGAEGPRLTISTACSSSANAIGLGRDLLKAGTADIVIAGGADVLWPDVWAGFHLVGVLSAEKCAPFSTPTGTTLGEGAGFLVLERRSEAERRGMDPIALILGYGLSADAYHETAPDPMGTGIARALRSAMGDARLQPADVDYVNAHGTGTAASDPAECRALGDVLGAEIKRVPVSSSKSVLGHGQGAAGVLELIVTILSMKKGMIPPTLSYKGMRPGCSIDAVGEGRPRPHAVRHALSVSAAFGGANAVVAVGAVNGRVATAPLARKPIMLLGVGAVGPAGADVEALAQAQASRTPLRGEVGSFDLRKMLATADPRGMDPSARFVTAASALALKDAGVTIRGGARDRAGIILGTTRLPVATYSQYQRSIQTRGLQGIASAAFARIVANSPAGTCAKLLGLRGLTTAVSAGPGTGLAAIIYAAALLAERDDADVLVATAVDEVNPPAEEDISTNGDVSEGAVSVVLARAGGPFSAGAGAVQVLGWGVAGPGHVEEAVRTAGAVAELPDGVVDVGGGGRTCLAPEVGDAEDLPAGYSAVEAGLDGAEGAGAAWAVALAIRKLRRGEARSMLVTTSGGRSATCALRLAAASN